MSLSHSPDALTPFSVEIPEEWDRVVAIAGWFPSPTIRERSFGAWINTLPMSAQLPGKAPAPPNPKVKLYVQQTFTRRLWDEEEDPTYSTSHHSRKRLAV